MQMSSENGNRVEMLVANSDSGDADLMLTVRVRWGSFCADTEVWILRAAWMGFAQELTSLEEKRQGSARLTSISPGELDLVVRSIDRAGHLGVEGTVGEVRYDGVVRMTFSVFAFEPSQLVTIAQEARRLSESLGRGAGTRG